MAQIYTWAETLFTTAWAWRRATELPNQDHPRLYAAAHAQNAGTGRRLSSLRPSSPEQPPGGANHQRQNAVDPPSEAEVSENHGG